MRGLMGRLASILSGVLILSLSFSPCLHAQSTQVKGRVLDGSTGEGIPFAGVYFQNTTKGVSTDMGGWFAIETREDSLTVLSVSCAGISALSAFAFSLS